MQDLYCSFIDTAKALYFKPVLSHNEVESGLKIIVAFSESHYVKDQELGYRQLLGSYCLIFDKHWKIICAACNTKPGVYAMLDSVVGLLPRVMECYSNSDLGLRRDYNEHALNLLLDKRAKNLVDEFNQETVSAIRKVLLHIFRHRPQG
jgi:hypothetical protein